MLAIKTRPRYAVSVVRLKRTDYPSYLRALYRTCADIPLLVFPATWAFAALGREIPIVPWEYPAAIALLLWGLALLMRRTPHYLLLFAAMFSLAALLLTTRTGIGFLPFLCICISAGGAALMLRRAFPLFSRSLFCYAATQGCLAPAYYLDFTAAPLSVFTAPFSWALPLFIAFHLFNTLLPICYKERV